ncbi:MAG TPA: hypothetical protein VFX89_05380, partial [Gammaproteobacteria bacterium]|nr:hypothetical protein [Gammaproteobacteria bacterium]
MSTNMLASASVARVASGARRRRYAALALVVAAALAASCAKQDENGSALLIEKQGGFAVGGTTLGDAAASLHCDHGVVEYQIPPHARSVSLLMWHSASALAWQ